MADHVDPLVCIQFLMQDFSQLYCCLKLMRDKKCPTTLYKGQRVEYEECIDLFQHVCVQLMDVGIDLGQYFDALFADGPPPVAHFGSEHIDAPDSLLKK